MIPAEFDYTAPDTLDGAIQALADGGEDGAPQPCRLQIRIQRVFAQQRFVEIRRFGQRRFERGVRRFELAARCRVRIRFGTRRG